MNVQLVVSYLWSLYRLNGFRSFIHMNLRPRGRKYPQKTRKKMHPNKKRARQMGIALMLARVVSDNSKPTDPLPAASPRILPEESKEAFAIIARQTGSAPIKKPGGRD